MNDFENNYIADADVLDDTDSTNEYEGRERPLVNATLWLALVVGVIFFLMVLLGCSSVALAGTSACENIRDSDSRHMCRAQANHDKSECELVKDGQRRALCRALVSSR